jgi:hypothetical protein
MSEKSEKKKPSYMSEKEKQFEEAFGDKEKETLEELKRKARKVKKL